MFHSDIHFVLSLTAANLRSYVRNPLERSMYAVSVLYLPVVMIVIY